MSFSCARSRWIWISRVGLCLSLWTGEVLGAPLSAAQVEALRAAQADLSSTTVTVLESPSQAQVEVASLHSFVEGDKQLILIGLSESLSVGDGRARVFAGILNAFELVGYEEPGLSPTVIGLLIEQSRMTGRDIAVFGKGVSVGYTSNWSRYLTGGVWGATFGAGTAAAYLGYSSLSGRTSWRVPVVLGVATLALNQLWKSMQDDNYTSPEKISVKVARRILIEMERLRVDQGVVFAHPGAILYLRRVFEDFLGFKEIELSSSVSPAVYPTEYKEDLLPFSEPAEKFLNR